MIRTFFRYSLALGCFTLAGLAPATGTLTVGTYNIHAGVPEGQSTVDYPLKPTDIKNIADVITGLKPDLLALQEVRTEWRSLSSSFFAPDIIRLLAGHTDMSFVFASTLLSEPELKANTGYLQWGTHRQWTNNGAPHGEFGNGVLSKLPLRYPASNLTLPMAKPGEEQRGCLRVETVDPVPGLGPVVLYSTHLHHNNPDSREIQMREILKHAKADATTATVFIAGDLNFSPKPGTADLIAMAKEGGFFDLAEEHAKATGTPPANTLPASKPRVRIDYLLCNKKLPVESVRTIETTVSDHVPLVVRVKTQ